jgi:hypothetical protein
MNFPPHVWGLLQLPCFHTVVTFGESPIRASDRKELAVRLQEAVAALFDPVV